jgi:hypothetical protein
LVPRENLLVELGTAMGNPIVGGASCYDRLDDAAVLVCGNWTASFGDNRNQIVYSPNSPVGLEGNRATEIGVKFAHIHPSLATPFESTLYHNANGTCVTLDGFLPQFCRFDDDCPANADCQITFFLQASITATVYDIDNQILQKATQSLTFRQAPVYAVYSTNVGLFSNQELFESVDYQYVEPNTLCRNTSIANSREAFSSAAPYAPRFIMFGQAYTDTTFPHPEVENLVVEINSDTKGTVLSAGAPIGSIDLVQPENAGGFLVSEGAGVILPSTVFGGTAFATPLQTGSVPGLYVVRVMMLDGTAAESRTVVQDNIGSPSTPASAVSPTLSPSALNPALPTTTVGPGPSSVTTATLTPVDGPGPPASTVAPASASRFRLGSIIWNAALLISLWGVSRWYQW